MKQLLISIVALSLLWSCSSRDQKETVVDSPTSGELTIAVDEALKPLIEAEITTFNSLYKGAHVRAFYVSEETALDTLFKDSVRMAIVARKLIPAELDIIKQKKIKPVEVKAALSGIALLVNPQNPDTAITVDDFKRILKGEIKTWKQLDKKLPDQPISVVFDQPNSGMIKYLNDSLLELKSLPPNCFAVDSNAAVVDYISKNQFAIGLIDVAWISDRDDATTNKFLASAKVMALSDGGEFVQPYQAYISLGQYPLVRDVMMVSQEGRSGLATGFITFVASNKGQLIVLKSGLVPATMPVRIVDVTRKPL